MYSIKKITIKIVFEFKIIGDTPRNAFEQYFSLIQNLFIYSFFDGRDVGFCLSHIMGGIFVSLQSICFSKKNVFNQTKKSLSE